MCHLGHHFGRPDRPIIYSVLAVFSGSPSRAEGGGRVHLVTRVHWLLLAGISYRASHMFYMQKYSCSPCWPTARCLVFKCEVCLLSPDIMLACRAMPLSCGEGGLSATDGRWVSLYRVQKLQRVHRKLDQQAARFFNRFDAAAFAPGTPS